MNPIWIQTLSDLLEVKERLLLHSLHEGTILSRDDPQFLRCLSKAAASVAALPAGKAREQASRILGHIRQFNPFNTSDVDENDVLENVIEDFLNFSRARLEKLGSSEE